MANSDIVGRLLEYVEHLRKTDSMNQIQVKSGLSNGLIGKWLSREGNSPSLDSIESLLKAYPDINAGWLLTGKGSMLEEEITDTVEEPRGKYGVDTTEATVREYLQGRAIRPITVTVDKTGKELISYVPVKAQAGYMRSYGDAEFIEGLPAFNLPVVDGKGTMRMFQVSGESMLQLGGGGLHDGDVVIGQYVEDIFSLRDNRVYVIVSTEGVVVKRVINRLTTSDKVLILKSDNKNGNYPDRLLHPAEILEVWELKAFISRQLSFSTDLWEVINDLQAKQAVLSERVDVIDSKTRQIGK